MADGYDIHSVGFGEQWNEVVFTEARHVSDDRVLITTALLNPNTYREHFEQIKLDLASILDESEARSREGRRATPEETSDQVTHYISGADYQAAVAKALEELQGTRNEQLELDL